MNSLLPILGWLPAAALFLLPGWALTRRIGRGPAAATCFIGSAVILFNVVLLLDLLKLPLQIDLIAAVLCATALLILRLPRPAGREVAPAPAPQNTLSRWAWVWFIPPALALGSIGVRAVIDPLSGYDNVFRWDYLARLILERHSLSGYPPITAADFQSYGWCDGIPPLVSLLNFWTYGLAGSTAPMLTAPRVIAEASLLGLVVYRYAELIWGRGAGRPALAALSSSALAGWSVATGQETGLTALSLVSMLYFLERHAREGDRALLWWAALAASLGALSRDYTAAFPLLGVAVLILRRASRGSVLQFALVAGVTSAGWYLRNWCITGNPLYPQRLGGLFPGNAIYDETMRNIAGYWSPWTGRLDPLFIPKFLAALAGILAVLGTIGLVMHARRTWPLAAGCAASALLWAISLPQTGGGWIYSARVLLPTLALLAVGAGWIARQRSWSALPLLIVLLSASADASRRAWLLPSAALTPVLPYSFAPWREARATLDQIDSHRVWQVLARVAGDSGIVVDHPSYHRLIRANGGQAVPLFSPVLQATFAANATFDDVRAQLHREHIRFLVLSRGSYMGEQLVDSHPFWRELRRRYRPNAVVGILLVYDLMSPEPNGQ